MKKIDLLLLLLLCSLLIKAQKYSAITLNPGRDDHHYTVDYYVNDILFQEIEYYCIQPVNNDNFAILLKSGILKKDGESTEFFTSGVKHLLIPFSKDKINGKMMEYYPSGELKIESIWEEGKRNGPFNAYRENASKILECQFVNGLKDGKEKVYDINGKLHALLNYKNGLFEGNQKTYTPEGKIKDKFSFEKGADQTKRKPSITGQNPHQLFNIPLSFEKLKAVSEKLELPDTVQKDVLLKIEMELLVDTDGTIKNITKAGTASIANQAYLKKSFLSVAGFEKASFDNIPIEYMILFPLYFYNGKQVKGERPKVSSSLTSTFGENFWIAACYLFEAPPEDPGIKLLQQETTLYDKIKKEKALLKADKMPQFPGGSEALRKYISQSVRYPVDAAKQGQQGKVYVTFIVEKDGSTSSVRIARSVCPSLDEEAMRVIKSMPTWTPGVDNGKLVRVSYTVPINFRLQ